MSLASIIGRAFQHAVVGLFVSIVVVSAVKMSRGLNDGNAEVKTAKEKGEEDKEEIRASEQDLAESSEAALRTPEVSKASASDVLAQGTEGNDWEGDKIEEKHESDDSFVLISSEAGSSMEVDTRFSDTSSLEHIPSGDVPSISRLEANTHRHSLDSALSLGTSVSDHTVTPLSSRSSSSFSTGNDVIDATMVPPITSCCPTSLGESTDCLPQQPFPPSFSEEAVGAHTTSIDFGEARPSLTPPSSSSSLPLLRSPDNSPEICTCGTTDEVSSRSALPDFCSIHPTQEASSGDSQHLSLSLEHGTSGSSRRERSADPLHTCTDSPSRSSSSPGMSSRACLESAADFTTEHVDATSARNTISPPYSKNESQPSSSRGTDEIPICSPPSASGSFVMVDNNQSSPSTSENNDGGGESAGLATQDENSSLLDVPEGWLEEDMLARSLGSAMEGSAPEHTTEPEKDEKKTKDEKTHAVNGSVSESDTTKVEWTKSCPWCGAGRPEDCCGLHPETMAAANKAANLAAKSAHAKPKATSGVPFWWHSLSALAVQKKILKGSQEKK